MHWRQTGFSISLQARFSAWHNVWVELKLWDYTMEVTGAAWRVKVSFTVYITFYYREVFCLAGIWKDQISLEIFAAWQHVGVRRLWELEEDGGGIMSFESELFWQARKKLPAVKGGGGGGESDIEPLYNFVQRRTQSRRCLKIYTGLSGVKIKVW